MSEPTENTSSGACERVLDYAYGELEGAAVAEFELHLKDCAKCQSELALMQRVRSAVKTVLPLIEPPQVATGALHAQLLHAAAQRRPVPRGKVLAFARRVVSHPGYAAAAALLVVGGALGLQFARGGLQMTSPRPEAAQEAAEAPKPVVTVAPAPEAVPTKKAEAGPVGAPSAATPPADKAGETATTKELDDLSKKREKADEPVLPGATPRADRKPIDESAPDLFLSTRSAAPGKAATHHAKAPQPSPEPKSAAPSSEDAAIVFDGKLGPNTSVGHVRDRLITLPSSAGGSGNSGAGDTRGIEGLAANKGSGGQGRVRGGNSNYRDPAASENTAPAAQPPQRAVAAKPAPSEPQPYAQQERAPAKPRMTEAPATANEPPAPQAAPQQGYAQAPSAPPASTWSAPSPPPPTVEKAPAPQPSSQYWKNGQTPQGAVAMQQNTQKQAGKDEESQVNNLARSAESLRRKAEELASTGRCDEAVKLYQELEKQYPTFVVAPRDRLPYVRCLRATGHEQMANELEQLRNDNMNAKPAAGARQLDNNDAASPMRAERHAAPAKAKATKKSRATDDATLSPALK